MQLDDKQWSLKKTLKLLFKHFPKARKNKPNEKILVLLQPLINLLLGGSAIFFLYYVDILPSTMNGQGIFTLFIIGIMLNIGYCIYSELASRLIKDDDGIKNIIFCFLGACFFTYSVAISKDFLIFWPCLIVNSIVAIHYILISFLPPVLKPIKTQYYKARYYYIYVLNAKRHKITEDDAENCWQHYVETVRNKADFIDHAIPVHKCFKDPSKEEKEAIIIHTSNALLFKSLSK